MLQVQCTLGTVHRDRLPAGQIDEHDLQDQRQGGTARLLPRVRLRVQPRPLVQVHGGLLITETFSPQSNTLVLEAPGTRPLYILYYSREF